MENLKMFVKKFNQCGNCGAENRYFEIFRNNDLVYHDWCVQCTECGCNMQGKTFDELLKKWNLDVPKEPDETEILKAENEKLKEEIEKLKAYNERLMSYKRFKRENECLKEENKRLFKMSQRSGLENLSPDELLELSNRMKDVEEGHRTLESKRWSDEHDSREALRLSEQLHRTGYLNPEDRRKFDNYVVTGVLSRARECLNNAAKREGGKRAAAHKFVERSRFIYDI